MKTNLRDVAIVGVFSALAVTGAYLFIPIHNVEIFTALIFMSGVLFGTRIGVLVGAISATIYGTINPFGMSPLPLLAIQVFSRAVTGYVGGRYQAIARNDNRPWLRRSYFALAGFLLTLIYIVLTLLSSMATSGFSLEQLKAVLAFGAVSYLILTVGNTAIFALVMPVAVDNLRTTSYFQQRRSGGSHV